MSSWTCVHERLRHKTRKNANTRESPPPMSHYRRELYAYIFNSLCVFHHREAFVFVREVIRAAANHKVYFLKLLLALLKHACVTEVEEVEDTICVCFPSIHFTYL